MIVTDEHVSTALAYLAAFPNPLARAARLSLAAENEAKRAFARAFLNAQGSVEQRKAVATLDAEYVAAQERYEEAEEDHIAQKEQSRWADKVIDLYRTENANARAAERIR